MGLDISEAEMNQLTLFGGVIDSWKHFDMYNHDVTLKLLVHCGWDESFCYRMQNMWTNQKVSDKISNTFGGIYDISNGLGQGCSFSLAVVKLTASIWCRWLDIACPKVSKGIFIYDRSLRSLDKNQLVKAD